MGSVRSAFDSAVSAMATEKQHEALVEACRVLADLIDLGGFDDKLWREFRLLLKDLREAVSSGGPDELSELLAELRSEV